MRVSVKIPAQIVLMTQSAKILKDIMDQLWEITIPGTATLAIDNLAMKLCKENKVIPSFLGFKGEKYIFPAAVCVCLNKEVVHGVPSATRIIKEGDIVTIDMGVLYEGWHSDMTVSRVVGRGSEEARNVVIAADTAVSAAIDKCRPGNYLKEVCKTIFNTANQFGCKPMLEFVGHGIGRQLHEDPQIPGYWIDEFYENPRLQEGMALAIEAILTAGDNLYADVSKTDHWTAWPKDNALTSTTEHTVIVADPPQILTK
jgi:methionyl aminopeptidase